MADVVEGRFNHPLAGTWVSAEGDSAAEFTIVPTATGFAVSGRDQNDGEQFVISQVSWDGRVLRFCSLMPSTGYHARHVLHVLPGDNSVEHELTLFERWQRK
jgi:hypothetical protein